MAAFDDFWRDAGPGLFSSALSGGLNWLGASQSRNEAERRSAEARAAGAPFTSAARSQLNAAQGFDTAANAKARFDAEMALTDPGREAQRQELARRMLKYGVTGISTDAPIPGVVNTGERRNPHEAALYAAQETARQKAAAGALDASQNTLTAMTTRAGNLNYGANTASAGARANQVPFGATRGAGNAALFKTLGQIGMSSGLFGKAGNWLANLGGDRRFGDFTGGSEWTPYRDVDWSTGFGD